MPEYMNFYDRQKKGGVNRLDFHQFRIFGDANHAKIAMFRLGELLADYLKAIFVQNQVASNGLILWLLADHDHVRRRAKSYRN